MPKTPLYARHLEAKGKITDFAGWELPLQYTGILEEHHATRQSCTMFDTCHMGRINISGNDALAFLEGIVTLDVASLEIGQCRYGFMLRPDGGVIDDLIVYHRSEKHWLMVVNAGTRQDDVAWLHDHINGDVKLDDRTDTTGKIDVQGPRAVERLQDALQIDASPLKRFRTHEFVFEGNALLISRTGYTGEAGFEIYALTDMVVPLWDRLLAAHVQPAGLGARDTLRMEAGLPLYGHELSTQRTPVHANMDRFIRKEKPFIGSEAITRLRDDPSIPRTIGFTLTGRRTARPGDTVCVNEQPVGQVTSGSFAPSLGCGAGMACINRDVARPDIPITIGEGRRQVQGVTAALPLYRTPA